MRKLMLLIVVGSLALPATGWAQDPIFCADCKIGLYDEPEMINNTGAVSAGVPKEIYVGVRLPETETGVTVIEFSVAGMRQIEDGILVISTEGMTDPLPNIILGSVPAPADTTIAGDPNAANGVDIAWASCISVSGSRVLAKITFLSFSPVTNKVFKVLRRYPPTNPLWPWPLFARCDAPVYTLVGVNGGCYIAGWDGTTDPVNLCQVETAVEENTWSGMKQLFR